MSSDPAAALTVLSKDRDAPTPIPHRVNPMRADLAKRTALILEDDPCFKTTIEDFLTASGFEVIAVPNGDEGLREVLRQNFDLILCDLLMPTLSGDLFYRAVERTRPHLCERFVFMTGYREDSKVSDFVTGASGALLFKPFPMDELLELIAFIELRGRLMAA